MIGLLCISVAVLGIIIIFLTFKLSGAENKIDELTCKLKNYSIDNLYSSHNNLNQRVNCYFPRFENDLKALEPLRELASHIEKEKKRIEFEHKGKMIVDLLEFSSNIMRKYHTGGVVKDVKKPKKSVAKQVKKSKKK